MRAFSKLIDMQIFELEKNHICWPKEYKASRARSESGIFRSTSFSSLVKGPGQKIAALGIFLPLVSCLSLSANERPVFGLGTNERPVRSVACPDSPRVGNTLECLDRDNQFQPPQARLLSTTQS